MEEEEEEEGSWTECMSNDWSASFPDWPRNLKVFWGNKALSEGGL